jgi:hypothetical protein
MPAHARLRAALRGGVRVAVASADADMQQHLGAQVAWLQLLQLETRDAPAAVRWVTAEGFEAEQGFPPAAFAELQALAGKAEASVGGVGVGAGPARRLLAQFGSVEAAMAAAAAGKLKGWAPAVRAALDPATPAHRQLRSNLQLLTAARDPGVLTEAQKQALSFKLPPAGPPRASSAASQEELAWLHPRHAWRWRAVRPLAGATAAALRQQGLRCELKAATAEGLPVDIVVRGSGSSAVAAWVVVCCELDFAAAVPTAARHAAAAPPAQRVHAELRRDAQPAAPRQPALPPLNSAMSRHVQLLRKAAAAAGSSVVCLPWWQLGPEPR